MPIGEIRLFAGNFAPLGWELCEGQILDAREHSELRLRIGKTFGGDENTVVLPDLRGRVPMHSGSGINIGDKPTIGIDPPQPMEHVTAKIHINYIILLQQLQRMDEGDAFVGEIRMFAGGKAHRGWIPCDGRAMRIFENTALFSILGYTYGKPSSDTFWLPNLKGRMQLHPPTRDDLGQTTDVRGIDVDAQKKTHLAIPFFIAGEGVFPARA